MAHSSEGLNALFANNTKLIGIIQNADTTKVLLCDLMAQISSVSSAAFELVAKFGWLSRIQEYFGSDDILLKLNIMKLLSTVCLSHYFGQITHLVAGVG